MKKIFRILLVVFMIASTLLLMMNGLVNVNAADTYPFKGTISSATLVVHNAPNYSDSSYVTELAYGTVVDVLGKNSGLYKIQYDTDKIGYVSPNYVINVDNSVLTTDYEGVEKYNDYCNTLVSGGFDKSYCPYLYYLHVKYPKWVFKADLTKDTLEDAASAFESSVVLQTDNKNYWLNGKYIEGSYYFIKSNVIASLMDPRNSLYESRIFQFLDLEESKAISNEASLLKISGNTGNLRLYVKEFQDAALQHNINPLHIMARSSQEGANSSKYDETTKTYVAKYGAVTGTYTTDYSLFSVQGYSLDGYYNFYNIGSYADKNYSIPVQRGLAHAAGFVADSACIVVDEKDSKKAYYDSTKVKEDGKVCGELSYQRPWNTPAKAIAGGADFIANDYVRMGQDNLYFQKFNVASYTEYKLYTHSYMTNGAAAISEGTTMYNAYKAGNLLNSEFVFVIPVYKNMPDTTYQPVDKSDNTRLKSIKINDKKYEFDADVLEHKHNLVTEKDKFTVSAVTEDSLSKIEGIGEYTFVDGKAQVKLVVTAEDGTVGTYTIDVTRVVPIEVVKVSDVVSKIDVKVNETTMYGISPDTAVTTIINTVTKNKGTAVVTDKNGKNKVSGSFFTGDRITIKGTEEEITYTIAVRGDINGDGLVNLKDFVLVQSHILKKSIIGDYVFYAGDVNFDGKIVLADFVLIQSHILKKQYL